MDIVPIVGQWWWFMENISDVLPILAKYIQNISTLKTMFVEYWKVLGIFSM